MKGCREASLSLVYGLVYLFALRWACEWITLPPFFAGASSIDCLRYGFELPPVSLRTFVVHARACQERCAASSSCKEFRFFESGLCVVEGAPVVQRRKLLLGMDDGDNSNKSVTGLSSDDFYALPYDTRGKVNFEMLEACYG